MHRTASRTTAVRRAVFAAIAITLLTGVMAQAPAGAVVQDQDRLPTADPVDNTPRVQDGGVKAITRYGNRVFVGGTFTTVQPGGGGTSVTRNRLFSYDHLTGQLDAWNPNMNGEVTAIAVSPDGRWVYAAGVFSQTDGKGAQRIARWDVATGVRDTTFKPTINVAVNDMVLRGGVIYLAGRFTAVNGLARAGLAAIDANTGATLPMNLPLTVPHTTGTTTAGRKLDVTADGSKLVVIGNFRQVGGADRRQLALINLDGTGGGSVATTWRTNRYAATCSGSFDSYMHDVQFSPDGSWFGVVTTGAWYGTSTLCDAVARFETDATGTDIAPTWSNYTGGDTFWSIAITSEAVYVGGHQRWLNNSAISRGDVAGPGAVARDGIGALDPLTGLPLRWNPGKERGVGTFEITTSSDTLFIGHDTNLVAGELRPRLSGFPFGSDVNVDPQPIALPATMYQGRTDGSLRKASVDTGVTGVGAAPSAGINWSQLKGGFYQNGQLYGWGLGGQTFTRRSFDGTTAGAPTDLIAAAGYAVSPPNNFTNVRAAAYDNGRLFYLRSGSSTLYWRWFSLESGIAGSAEFTANGSSYTSVTGIEIAGGQLYQTRTDGRLYRSTVNGGSVSSTQTLVDSSTNWSSGNDLFFLPGVGGTTPDVTPPSQPGKPAATSLTTGQADLTWAASTDDRATTLTYSVFRDGGSTPVGTVTAGTTGTVSFTDTGLTPGTIHSWTVRASDGTNNSLTSLASDPVVIAGASGPTVLASSDFGSGLTGWTGINGLTVDDAVGSPAPSALAAAAGNATTARLALSVPASASCSSVDVRRTSVTGNNRYAILKLRTAGNVSIARVWSDSVGRLSIRNDITGVRTDTAATLPADAWANVKLCATVGGAAGNLSLVVDGVLASSITTDTGTAPYTSFQLGDNEARTAEVRFDNVLVTATPTGTPDTAPTAPGKPSGVSTAPGEATLTWDAATDDLATTLTYSVFRDGGATPVGTVTGGTTGTVSFTDTGMQPGTVHTWTVRASDGNLTGPASPASDPVVIAGSGGPIVLAADDFTGGLAAWTGVSGLSVDASIGSPTAPSVLANVNSSVATGRLSLGSPATSSCSSVDVRLTSVTGTSRYALFKLRTASNASIARVWVDSGRRLSVRNDITGVRNDTTAVLAADTWTTVSLCADVNGAAGTLTLLVNGVVAGTWTTDTGSAAYAQLQLGDNEARTAVVRFDNVTVASA